MKKGKKLLLFLALALVGALLFISVSAWIGENPGRGKSLAEAREALEQELLPLAGAGFVGIAHSEAEGGITVFVEDEQTKQRVPRYFEGYVVRTEVTGKIQAFSTQVAEPLTSVNPERREEVSPLVGGISLSAYATDWSHVYAGTLGMVTYDDKILSNAHVIAMNPDTYEFLATGTPIIQPGSLDGGGLSELVGELEAYMPIDFNSGAENYADAAIGSIDGGVEASPGEQFSEGDNYWLEGWAEVSTGDIVRKSGRTTGVTTGEVLYTNYSGEIGYGDQSAHFVDVIVVVQENWSFAKQGDSGSAVDKDGEFVGLIFAGSADSVVICKAEHIIEGLGIAVEPQAGQYSLTISSTEGGEVTVPGEGMFIRDAEEVVDLVAEADLHYHFVKWTGDVDNIDNPDAASTNITMDGSYSVTANFALDPGYYSLTISSTEGGEVSTPGEETFVYPASTNVSLVAQADVDNHYHFVEWTGGDDAIGNVTAAETTITMNDSYSITANFGLDPGWYSLTISSTDGGMVTKPGEGIFIHAANTTVALVAVPDEGYQFLKWTGDVSTIADVNAASTTIAMNSSYSITANFESPHPEPKAQLTVSSNIGGRVADPGEGTFLRPLGAKVPLLAEPVSGYQFSHWSGDVETIADIDAASTTIAMNGDYSIIANFSGAGSRCFIATAAYGTPMAEEIEILREFRDGYLLTNPVGQALVDFYYRVSPPVAEFITEHPSLKPIVRVGLLPAVTMSTVAVNTTPARKVTMAGLLALVSVAVAAWVARRRGRGSEYT